MSINKINLIQHNQIAVPPKKACNQINEFIEKNILHEIPLIGHNIQFDKIQTYHDIEVDNERGWFECRAVLDYKGKDGLYYLTLWLRDETNNRSVHAATVTIDVVK